VTVVRVCPEHGRELRVGDRDRLICPEGHHVVTRWNVVDVARSEIVGEASAEEVGMKSMRKKVATRPHQAVAVKVLEGQNFTSRNGARLQLRLLQFTKLERYRVRWTRIDKSKTAQAYCADETDAAAGQAAYVRALKEAGAAGWEAAGYRQGGRGPRIAPIPKP
jgi:hypothetical protein